jgi:hypothetical protein
MDLSKRDKDDKEKLKERTSCERGQIEKHRDDEAK